MIHLFKAHYLLAVICLRHKYQGTKELSSQALPNQMVCTELSMLSIYYKSFYLHSKKCRVSSPYAW